MMRISTLEFVEAIRRGESHADGRYKTERRFLDLVVDGSSLWEALGKRHDMVSVLCYDFDHHNAARATDRLLLRHPADLPNNRRSLFICAECGDLGCGTISIVVERDESRIVWRDFGYENTYDEGVCLDDYAQFGPFVFDAGNYERTLRNGLEVVKKRNQPNRNRP